MKPYFIFWLLLLCPFGYSQIKELNPSSTILLNFSLEAEKGFNDTLDVSNKIFSRLSNGTKYEDLTPEEKDIISKVDESMEDYWEIFGSRCSWYCGGGPKDVTASSYLKSQGSINYEPRNAHDLNYKNAWAEGVSGYGIGEFLLYTFEGASPRITDIIVVNGYVKSQSAWENNSRVKKLKVYLNDRPYAILNLKDIRGSQSFKVAPIGNSDRKNWEMLKAKPDWTLKFEILDIYKGLKYDDVVISEIYFDGLDVHCLAKGTKILMGNQSFVNIEHLKMGDSVAYLDLNSKIKRSARIEKLEKVTHHGLVTYKFESGREITATQDHPFKIQDKGWASLKPENSKQYQGFQNIEKIAIGDYFISVRGTDRLIGINYIGGDQITYSISKLSSGDHFIANGLVVGIEEIIE